MQSAWPRKLLVMTCLLMVSTRAWAPAPIYFDLGGLILLVAGLFIAVVLGVAWLAARKTGVVWAMRLMLALLVAAFVWANWSGHRATSGVVAWRMFGHDACHARELLTLPERSITFRKAVLVLPGDLWLRDEFHFQGGKPASEVEIAGVLPSVRSEDTAYVRITATLEDVLGTEGHQLRGFEVSVEDHNGAKLAKLSDYDLGHWCSGTTPPDLVERFIRASTGISTGFSLRWDSAERLRSVPRGSLSASIYPVEGKERIQRSAGDRETNLDEQTLKRKLGFPTESECRRKHEDRWICLEGTPEVNEFDSTGVGKSVVQANRWLTLRCDTSHCGTSPYRIDERDLKGRLVAVWYVRLPPVVLSPDGSATLLGVELTGNLLGLKLGGKLESNVWDADDLSFTSTYTNIKIARVKLDSRLLLPAIPMAVPPDGQGATH